MKVLVAEDDSTSRMMLQALIARWGFEAVAVNDGGEAWAVLRELDAPKLVLLDWMMPRVDGLEVCRKVREMAHPEPPYLIILTACGEKSDIVAGLNAGANDYIAKPFDNNELRARLEVGKRMVELQRTLAERVRDLDAALAHVKKLQGILPICGYCHKIRTDQASWERFEEYISEHSDAKFSHGICPDCMKKYNPEFCDEAG